MHGLYLEGAGWDRHKACLIKQKPKQLIQELPVLKVIPIEAHRLKLQVSVYCQLGLHIVRPLLTNTEREVWF